MGSERAGAESLAVASTLLRLGVRINQIAGFLVVRREHRLIAHAAPRLQVRGIGDAVILHLQRRLFGPLAKWAELDVAHDGLEFVAVQVFGELLVVERLGAFDRLAEQLEIGIAPAAEIVTERIGAGGLGALLIT